MKTFTKVRPGNMAFIQSVKSVKEKSVKSIILHNLEKKRAMYRIYNQKRAEREKLAKENEERLELLRASELLGGYRIYVLNHVKEGESKYTCVKVSTSEVYRTNDKRKFISYLEGVI